MFWVGLGKENEKVANQWLAFGTFVGNIVDAGGLSKTKKNLTDISWLVLLNGLLGGLLFSFSFRLSEVTVREQKNESAKQTLTQNHVLLY